MTGTPQSPIDDTDEVKQWVDRLIRATGDERSHAASELSRLGVWTRGSVRTRGSLASAAQSRLPRAEDLPGILAALQDRSPEVRAQVALALGEWGGPESAPALSDLLATETDDLVRLHCITALRTIGGPAALEGLHAALSSSSNPVRDAALGAIEELATGGRVEDSERPSHEPASQAPAASPVRTRGGVRVRGGIGTAGKTPGAAAVPGGKIVATLMTMRSNPAEPEYLRSRARELLELLGH
jgi:hypothetical protein